jgi:predicted metalloprotease
LSCPGPATAGIVSCLQASLTKFWSTEVGRRVPDRVIVSPKPADVPRGCRSALRLATAFTCPIGSTVYLTTPYIERLRDEPPTADAWYRFAATLAHEMGHVVQFAVHDKLVEKDHPNPADSRRIEQQADCLSGVWSTAVGIADGRFVAAAGEVFHIIDSPFERRTHGTPAARKTAIRRGQTGRTPESCGLTVQ